MNWAWKQPVPTSSQLFLLVAIADYANQDWEFWPSICALSEKTRLNRKTVISTIDSLVEFGILQDTGERKGATKQVIVYKICKEWDASLVNSPKNGTVPKTDGNSPVFTTKQSQKRTVTVPKTGHGTNQGTSKETNKEPSGATDHGLTYKWPWLNAIPEPQYELAAFFARFYEAYPNKVDPEGTWRAVKAKVKTITPELEARIMASLAAHRVSKRWQEGFILNPTTFVNQRRWEGDAPLPAASMPTLPQSATTPPPTPFNPVTNTDCITRTPDQQREWMRKYRENEQRDRDAFRASKPAPIATVEPINAQ